MLSKYNPKKDKPLDRYIKISDAARILDYAHYSPVKKLIDKGYLTAYNLPHVVRIRVLQSDVLKLKEQQELKKQDPNPPKKGRGRPSKYS